MSNALRYDALLTRDLAAGLDRLLRGARLDAILFERDHLHVTIITRTARRGDSPPSLLWQLHPDSGQLAHIDAAAAGTRIPLGARSVITHISAPPDERIIDITVAAEDAAAGATRRLVIELVTNQWNAIALGEDDRIVAVLRERRTRERTLRVDESYTRPARGGRSWAEELPSLEEWNGLLRREPPGKRMALLLKHAAYTSPLNVAAILGDADVRTDAESAERALRRYLHIVHDGAREAVLLAHDDRAQPYSVRLSPDDVACASLLDAFTLAAGRVAALPVAPTSRDVAVDAIAQRIDHVEQRMERLRSEQTGAAEESVRLRRHADLLLAQLQRVTRGTTEVEVDDFEGGTERVTLEPALSPADNAKKLYDAARKRARAAARIPALLAAAERELERLRDFARRIHDGTADDAEIARVVRHTRAGRGDEGKPLPYRLYRTSNGHEVRVGRGARANDELTFRHSSPNDIWLHARDVAGAHVILRWTRVDENPSARDIAEASVLAAVHSRARTSGTVAVDWTRRKYVRKPRKAPPGQVLPERVKTVFVEPDGDVEERLRAQP